MKIFLEVKKKKNEILQMLLLNPRLIILDEIDSGLDFISIKKIFDIINTNNEKSSFLIITHNHALVNVLNTTQIHIVQNKTLLTTKDKNIINSIIKNGYDSCF